MIPTSLRRFLILVGLLALSVESRAQTGAASLEVDFTVPSGYVTKPEGALLWLLPPTSGGVGTPCVYGLAPPRPSRGSLEADAEAALIETVALVRADAGGMVRSSDYRIARRGVAAAGWPFFLSGGDFQGQVAGNTRYLAFLALVFPATANRVNVVFGMGETGKCAFDDVPSAQLFHSLRPRGWSSPGGNVLERDLIGTWQGRGLSQHTFDANGRYSRSTAGKLFGNTISGEGDGRYALRGSEITITSRVAGQAPERFRVYIYDKWSNGRWERTMTVLYEEKGPPYVAEYVRGAQ
jgi:hypothetical protein